MLKQGVLFIVCMYVHILTCTCTGTVLLRVVLVVHSTVLDQFIVLVPRYYRVCTIPLLKEDVSVSVEDLDSHRWTVNVKQSTSRRA